MTSFAEQVSIELSKSVDCGYLPGLGSGPAPPTIDNKKQEHTTSSAPALFDQRALPTPSYKGAPPPLPKRSRYQASFAAAEQVDLDGYGEDVGAYNGSDYDWTDAGAPIMEYSYSTSSDESSLVSYDSRGRSIFTYESQGKPVLNSPLHYSANSYDSNGNLIFKPHFELPQFLELPINSELAQRRAIKHGESVEAIERLQRSNWGYESNLRHGLIISPNKLFAPVDFNPTHVSEAEEEVSPKNKTVALEPWMVQIEKDTTRFLDEVEADREAEEMAEWHHLLREMQESAGLQRTSGAVDDAVMPGAVDWERLGEGPMFGYGASAGIPPSARYRDFGVDMGLNDAVAAGMVQYM